MNTKLLAPAFGLVLLGGSALALADGGKHHRYRDGGHQGWHAPAPRWHGPAYHHAPRPHGYHPGPRWHAPRSHGRWTPRPHYRSGAWHPHAGSRDGVTVILRSSFH